MFTHIRPALVLIVLFTGVTGLAYPLAMTGVAQAVFPHAANGSPVMVDGRLVGSSLVGQAFTQPVYFWPRPSATGPEPYNGAASSGSNYGATDARLVARVAEAVAEAGGGVQPADRVTSSASGLDPHISPANARSQIARVAAARGAGVEAVAGVVDAVTEVPLMGILGEPRVNVLALNLLLDQRLPIPR